MKNKSFFVSLFSILLLTACSSNNNVEEGVKESTNETIEENEEVVENEAGVEVIEYSTEEAAEAVYKHLKDMTQMLNYEYRFSQFFYDSLYTNFSRFESVEEFDEYINELIAEEKEDAKKLFQDIASELDNYVVEGEIEEFLNEYIVAEANYDIPFIDHEKLQMKFTIENQTDEELIVSFIDLTDFSFDNIIKYTLTYQKDNETIKLMSYEIKELDEIEEPLDFEDIKLYWNFYDPKASLTHIETTETDVIYNVESVIYDFSTKFTRKVGNNRYTGEINQDLDDPFYLTDNQTEKAEEYIRETKTCDGDLYDCYRQKIIEVDDELSRRTFVYNYTGDYTTRGFVGIVFEIYDYFDEILSELAVDISEVNPEWEEAGFENWKVERENLIDELNDPVMGGTMAPVEAYSQGIAFTKVKLKELMERYLKEE